jgi:hypothetical protein
MELELLAFEQALASGEPECLDIPAMATDVYIELTLQGYAPEYLEDFFS